MQTSEIDRLVAESDITQSLLRYCRSMDRIDPQLGYTVWHRDGLADYQMFKGTGREFVDWVCEIHRGLITHTHQISPPMISVDQGRAVSETYVTASLVRASGTQQVVSTYRGRYLDNWSRREGRWAIDRRVFVCDFGFTQGIDMGPVLAQLGTGARDHSDLSYAMFDGLGAS